MGDSKQPQSGFGFYRPGTEGPTRASEAEEPDEADPVLADTAELDLSADEARKHVDETLALLDAELVGLTKVKRRVREIAALLLVDRARRQFGLSSSRPTLHMSFTGGPGTGKTTVALRMAEMLHAMGYIRSPKVHTVTRDDLVGQFIGHTAPKTKEALARAAGGVLFIDEAYYLHRVENERDYGQEVIEILLQEMESERASLVVVFAGYPDRMETFFSANPGLSSRVPHHIGFEDYSHDELAEIAEMMVADENFRFDEPARKAFVEYLALRMTQPRFSNARSVRNAVERCRLRQAKRLVELERPLTKDDLVTITDQDVYGSSIFQEEDTRAAAEGEPAATDGETARPA